MTMIPSGTVTAHCLRLHPGDELMSSLKKAASSILHHLPREQCSSVFIITAVGSLQDVTLRLANASRLNDVSNQTNATTTNDIKRYNNQRFEIVSLTGTFSRDTGCHVHIALADAEGNAVGGHFIDGIVFTTCELVLGTANGVEFVRNMDHETGYNELEVRQLVPRRIGLVESNMVSFGYICFMAVITAMFFWTNVVIWKSVF
jgi:predicted DNA-binding protein with PD1-like motif